MMLALSRRLFAKDRLVREGRWAERAHYQGTEIGGKTLGIVGFGGAGRELRRLVSPFAMKVAGTRPLRHGRDARSPGGHARRIPGGSVRAVRLRLDPLPAERRDAGHDRPRPVSPDEADRLLPERGARPDRERTGPDRRPAERRDRRRRPGRVRPGAAAARQPRCSPWTMWSLRRTPSAGPTSASRRSASRRSSSILSVLCGERPGGLLNPRCSSVPDSRQRSAAMRGWLSTT